MAIDFSEDDGNLILEYSSDRPVSWLDDKTEHTFNRTFTVTKKALLKLRPEDSDEDYEVRRFVIGSAGDEYRTISRGVLGLKHDLLISNSIVLRKDLFVAHRDISIFRRIDSLTLEQIVIGGDSYDAIPEAEFAMLLKNFPTSTELRKYADARIAQDLSDYFQNMSEAEQRLVRYMERRRKTNPSIQKIDIPIRTANELELEKYLFLREKFTTMLATEQGYRESHWQDVVADLFLLIFPQYIAVLHKVNLKESYSNPSKPTKREIDLMLVDANGGVDLIEIKRPFDDKVLARRVYRDNYIPHGELSGAIMQAEKYLYYLSKGGRDLEKTIQTKYRLQLPAGLEIKIANPKSIILHGRDHKLSPKQKFDLGIIRKKYSNMIDILTYDDLLRRIDNIIAMLKIRAGS